MNAAQQPRANLAPVGTVDAFEDIQISPDVEACIAQMQSTGRDTASLTAQQRTAYLTSLARALRLNPLTNPLKFIKLQGGETLYVTRTATDQLAAMHGLNRRTIDGPKVVDILGVKVGVCTVEVTLPSGRSETATATLPAVDPPNLFMKLETKAKRRATLSILGVGLLTEEELETIPAGSQAPSRTADSANAYTALVAAINGCRTLGQLRAAWHEHREKLDDDDAKKAFNDAHDWAGQSGYCITATDLQLALSKGWCDDARQLADELAVISSGAGVVEWYVGAKGRIEALRDPKSYKTFVARTWAARSLVETERPGNAFAKVVAAYLAAQETTREAAADEPAPIAPIVTSKGVELTSEAAVREHVGTIDNIVRLENTAKKYGAHPWAVGPLVERAAALLGVHIDEADAWVAKHATDAKGGA